MKKLSILKKILFINIFTILFIEKSFYIKPVNNENNNKNEFLKKLNKDLLDSFKQKIKNLNNFNKSKFIKNIDEIIKKYKEILDHLTMIKNEDNILSKFNNKIFEVENKEINPFIYITNFEKNLKIELMTSLNIHKSTKNLIENNINFINELINELNKLKKDNKLVDEYIKNYTLIIRNFISEILKNYKYYNELSTKKDKIDLNDYNIEQKSFLNNNKLPIILTLISIPVFYKIYKKYISKYLKDKKAKKENKQEQIL